MIYTCPHCKGQYQSEAGGTVRCPHCNGEAVVVETVRGTSWDAERQGRWVDAFFAQVKEAIASPVGYAHNIAQGTGWLRPYIFALIISGIAFLLAAAYQAGFQWLATGFSLGQTAFGPNAALSMLSVPISAGAMVGFGVMAVPIGTTFGLLIQTLTYHLCLMLLGAARRDFVSTFRVACYAMAPQVFQIVPVIGGVFAWGWQLALIIIGLKVTHETTYGRSAVAVFLPMLVCCGILLLIGSTVAGWVVAALVSASHH